MEGEFYIYAGDRPVERMVEYSERLCGWIGRLAAAGDRLVLPVEHGEHGVIGLRSQPLLDDHNSGLSVVRGIALTEDDNCLGILGSTVRRTGQPDIARGTIVYTGGPACDTPLAASDRVGQKAFGLSFGIVIADPAFRRAANTMMGIMHTARLDSDAAIRQAGIG